MTDRSTTDRSSKDTARLDIWLDVACLFKTRSEAKRACEGGKVEVNGQPAKPNRTLREGDRLRITRAFGHHQDIVVRVVIDQHVPKAQARALYDDVTPKLTPEEMEMRRMERTYRAAARSAGTPDRRRRRELRKLKEGS
jgi:ribosome-associated heat shock protein Hsp15